MDNRIIMLKCEKLLSAIKGLDSSSILNEECPIGIISMDNWEWPQGVALFAMYQYYLETKEKDVFDYLVDWYDKQIEKGLPYKNVNTICPMLTLTYIYEDTKNPKYLPLLKEWVDYALEEMPRTKENGIQHVVSGIINEGQLWDDTLYMTVLFIARMGIISKQDRYIQESISQFLIHIKYLVDVKTGLFYHGWTFLENHNFAKALWGRGNSWYTAGLVDYLEIAQLEPGIKDFLISTLETQVSKLVELQDSSGLWHTILDDPSSYLETSASCGFAYGILKAIRKGYIDDKFYEIGQKALVGVIEQINNEGIVDGVSYGTPVFNSIEEYKNIPICPMPYGQSMALLLLVEAMKAGMQED